MNYRYNCGNEVVRVWVWNDDFHTEVTVTDNKTNKSYERTIREDENGRFIVPLNIVSVEGFGISLLDGNKTKDTVCKIEERYNREVKQNYKLVVVPAEPDETVASYNDYYTMDMITLIQSGYIKIVA